MRNLPPFLYRYFQAVQSVYQAGARCVLSLFFPFPCIICDELQVYARVLCEPCSGQLPRITGGICRICGSPFPEHWRVKVCPDCNLRRPKLTRIRSLFSYDGAVIPMIREIKFARKARYLQYFAEEMYLLLLRRFPGSIGAIVPVPLHRARKWHRTFDQAHLLAKHLHELSGIPLQCALVRRKNTIAQTSLTGSARRMNLNGAFQLKKNLDLPRSVLLVDDVVTTGATLEACASVLRSAGVRRVYALTVARAVLK